LACIRPFTAENKGPGVPLQAAGGGGGGVVLSPSLLLHEIIKTPNARAAEKPGSIIFFIGIVFLLIDVI
jgi:hypothetical protein